MSGWRPARPIRLVVGFSPSSASDFIAATLAPRLSEYLGQPVELERHPGENGTRAARLVAQSEPDGHTIFIATLGTHAVVPNLPGVRPYDPVADFASLSSVARAPLVLAVHPSVPARSVAEFIDLARSAHGDLGYATSAIGGAPHLAGELFQAMANVTLRFRRYDRTRQLYEDLLAGRVESSFNNMMSMARYVDENKLRGLAVTSAARCPLLPALPTISESGLPGYEISNWLGLVAPAGTPGGIVSAHNDAIGAALRHPELIRVFAQHGLEPTGGPPDALSALIRSEMARFKSIVSRFAAA